MKAKVRETLENEITMLMQKAKLLNENRLAWRLQPFYWRALTSWMWNFHGFLSAT